MQTVLRADIYFWLFTGLALIVGIILRFYMLSEQILLDDEWHGIDYAIGNSFSYLLTHSGRGATCVPLNLYRRFLLQTVGWSELLLRLPAIIAGVLSLVIFPVLVKKIFSLRVTIVFAFLVAISPFLIFYSRVSRPYSIFTLLGFSAILSLYFWVTSGQRRYAVIYVITTVLAVYFHLFAAVVLLVPLCYVFLIKLIHKLTAFCRKQVIVPGFTGLIVVASSIVLLLPVSIIAPRSWLFELVSSDQISLQSLGGFVSLLSGTANKLMVVVFLGLLSFGQVQLLRKKPLLGGIFLFSIVISFMTLAISRPECINAPIVIARYIIPLFPLGFVLVAFGMEEISNYFRYGKVITAAFLVILFLVGPLGRIYARPNNFTNHSAFQESYEPLSWDRSYFSDVKSEEWPGSFTDTENIPSFYQRLSSQPDADVIIECPMLIRDHYNLYYYYQYFHKKWIIVGYYSPREHLEVKFGDMVYGDMYTCEVLYKVSDASKLRFTNMIDMTDIVAIRNSRAKYIILHKNIESEMALNIPSNAAKPDAFLYLRTVHLNKLYRNSFGPPVFEDDNLLVFENSPTTVH